MAGVKPPRTTPGLIERQNVGQDPAKYMVDPGEVIAPGKHTPGKLRHARPYLVNGRLLYVFPIGVEGFRRSGSATLGLRHYIGYNTADGVTIMYEEARIELSGTFPGLTSQRNMVDCINMLRSPHKRRGLVLYAPGVFNKEQFVLPESWDFQHSADDRTHSIDYNITLVRIGEGPKVKDPHGEPPRNLGRNSSLRGKPTHSFTVNAKYRTLRGISAKVYNDPNKWTQIVSLNLQMFAVWSQKNHKSLGSHALAVYRWPIGTKFRY